jgi:hypothetical protein
MWWLVSPYVSGLCLISELSIVVSVSLQNVAATQRATQLASLHTHSVLYYHRLAQRSIACGALAVPLLT